MSDNPPIDVVHAPEDTAEDQQNVKKETGTLEEQNDASRQTKPNEDVPPDGGYGWVCVACVFWINAHTWGVNSVCFT